MWEVIIGLAAIVAAIAASVGLWLQLRWRRPDLSVAFLPSASTNQKAIAFVLTVRNDGDHTARDVTSTPLLDDEPAGEVNPVSQSIAPTNIGDFSFYLSRPSQADFEPGQKLTSTVRRSRYA